VNRTFILDVGGDLHMGDMVLDEAGMVDEVTLPDEVSGFLDRVTSALGPLRLTDAKDISVIFSGTDVLIDFSIQGKSHRWANPGEWFEHHLSRHATDTTMLYRMVGWLAAKLDFDALQEVFEGEMTSDGYFEQLHPTCTYCGGKGPLYVVGDERLCIECKEKS